MEEKTINDIVTEVYTSAENKDEIDFWAPLIDLVFQATELRIKKGLNQAELSKIMQTRQSAISRFENLGRKPTYEFLARIAQSLGQNIGLTLYGDYMAIVPEEKRDLVREEARKLGISTKVFTQNLLEGALQDIEEQKYWSGASIIKEG